MSDSSEYVATAAAEKRLREVLGDLATDALVARLCEGVKVEYKPRLKSVVLTVGLPDAATPVTKTDPTTAGSSADVDPELGVVRPDDYPEAAYAPILDTTWQPRPVGEERMFDGDPVE